MDTDLLSRILREARDAAPNPSAAMAIEDLTRDLDPLLTVLETSGDVEEPMDVAAYITDFKALADHIQTQPFDVSDTGKDEFDAVTIQELTPGAFAEWLDELERLAQ
jgi:hypothetical protein